MLFRSRFIKRLVEEAGVNLAGVQQLLSVAEAMQRIRPLVRPARTVGSMRLYSRDEIGRLRFIKRLVDEAGVNLAGVQQLLSVAEAMQRIRPMMRPGALQRDATRRRLVREMDQLAALLGLDDEA